MKTRTKVKLLRFFGINLCKKRDKYPDKESIFRHRRIGHSEYPENWMQSPKLYTCQDGVVIPYGFEENFKQSHTAITKLSQELGQGVKKDESKAKLN